MKKIVRNLFILSLFITLLSSCRTAAPQFNYRELAKASIRLGVDIDLNDNHHLYIESANWIGVPHRMGGNSKRGIDCSGLSTHLYKEVYKKRLERNSNDQLIKNCLRISKSNLREGDLVFFHNGRDKRRASHVGVYLKNNLFIHTSNRGVTLNSLNESYYQKHWLAGGRKK